MKIPEFLQKIPWLRVACILAGALVLMLVLVLPGLAPEAEIPTEPTLPPPEENPYSPEDFYMENGILLCSASQTLLGIDVSAHQKVIDWQKVADFGVNFAIIRLGYRGYVYGELHADELFRENVRAAREAGIRVGAYFFSQALNEQEAREEAEFALSVLEGVTLDLPLAYDWERMGDDSRTAQMDRRTLTDCTKAFCTVTENAGVDTMIYFNSSQALNLLHLEELTDYPFWLAMYDVTMDFPYRFDYWQYSNLGVIPGIETKVDLNLLFVNQE